MSLFGRKVVLQFGQPGEEGKSLTGLRISFNIKHTLTREPSAGTIVVWGLDPTSIAELQRPGVQIRLLAGYRVPQVIFQGNPVRSGVRIAQAGPERTMTVEVKDGGREIQQARLELTWETETSLQQIVDEASAQLGIPQGTIQIDQNVRYPDGITIVGSAADVLDRVADMSNASWTVRDGALVILQDGNDTGEEAIQVSANAGNMIGSPTPRDDGTLEVVSLMETAMRPGRLFRVISRQYNGDYIAREVVYQGDSGYDTPFYTRMIGRERAS